MRALHRIPLATYRLQLRKEFPFSAATATIPYLHKLGITDLYLSPISLARPGSPHGYDVLDHERLNPELGDDHDLHRLMEAADSLGMGIIFDIVPNHMCILGDNPRWMEVLEDGSSASSAEYFDIDWDPPKAELAAKILLPFLDDQYGHVLESKLTVSFQDGGFSVSWGGGKLPIAPETSGHVLRPALELLQAAQGKEAPAVLELESIVRALTHTLPALKLSGTETAHLHEKQAIRRRLASLVAAHPVVHAVVQTAVAQINGVRGIPQSFDRLEQLMNDQVYRLAHWRVAAHEINYRRFFDVNELAAVRVEDPKVFATVHALPLSLVNHPAFTGFRIDHLDGLADPKQYLDDLAASWRQRMDRTAASAEQPYVIVEKILGATETLREDFAADGTTGYDFIGLASGMLLYEKGVSRLRAIAGEITGAQLPFAEVAAESKHLVLESTLAAEVTVLARRLDRLSEQQRYTRDFTLNHLQAALSEAVASFSIYRTYVREHEKDSEVSTQDSGAIAKAVFEARRRSPLINASIFTFIESLLLHRDPVGLRPEQIAERREFVSRFQQLTGPVFAKGVEDTAFYRYLPLLALNEVGCDPSRGQLTDENLHARLSARGKTTPHTLSATATHDTKRGEDARARLYVLSEVADAWSAACTRWVVMNRSFKSSMNEDLVPYPTEEYLLYQTLVATWPMDGFDSLPTFTSRIAEYMTKARHEAKLFTSYVNPNATYEAAATAFVTAVLDPSRNQRFLDEVQAFVSTVLAAGICNSLAQVVLKISAPGVPDFFQGRETWDFSLVDPDNRHPVDFPSRPTILSELFAEVESRGHSAVTSWFQNPADGRIKMWTTAAALRMRRARATLLQTGEYVPIACEGPAAKHVFAFARRHDSQAVLSIIGRHVTTLGVASPVGKAWHGTMLKLPHKLASSRLRDCLTGQTVHAENDQLPLDKVFLSMPVSLLETM